MTDLANLSDTPAMESDVAVVGSGPVGLKVALDLADAGMKVQLIESGFDHTDSSAQAHSDAEVISANSHAPMSLAVKRSFGGTSHLWGGRAVAFDNIDFASRSYAPNTQWPIMMGQIAPWYETACDFLDCGPPKFSDQTLAERESRMNGLELSHLERWCANPNMRTVHGERVRKHPNIRLDLGTTVLRVNIDSARGIVRDLLVSTGGSHRRIAARNYVVAAGGLETTRLLLASQISNPNLFGGPNGPLGRFYMGHIFGSIADIVFDDAKLDQAFTFKRDASGRFVRRRFTLSSNVQRQNSVLNLAAWPEPPDLDDPRHGSGILSLAYLALRAPVIGPMLTSEAIRQRKIAGTKLDFAAHARNILRDIFGSTAQALSFLRARYARDVRLPGFFVLNKAHRYAFHFHGEHLPNAESRVTLSQHTDTLGQPRLSIDLRFSEADAASVLRTHMAMDERLRSSGIAHLEYPMPPAQRSAAVLAQASDGFHQIGTARMSENDREGVVDANARVHGVSNLYLAGSAIFVSSGQANPTLTAVALAARLAAHLKNAQLSLPNWPSAT